MMIPVKIDKELSQLKPTVKKAKIHFEVLRIAWCNKAMGYKQSQISINRF